MNLATPTEAPPAGAAASETTEVKVAECAALFWQDGKLVWDDYLDHRQHALTAPAELLCRWFASWRPLASAQELGDAYPALAARLLDAGVLIAAGSERHRREQALLARWGPWGSGARHFHYQTRTLQSTRFVGHEQDVAEMRERAQEAPPPPYASEHPERPLVPLPGGGVDDRAWPRPRLLDALRSRRSTRRFSPRPLTPDQLAGVLELAGGILEVRQLDTGPAVFKTSPSAGAWHPVELHVRVRRVEGIEPGAYHYAPTRGGLERAEGAVEPADELGVLGGQRWLAEAPALVVYTGVVERGMWRYPDGRAYRDLLVGLGHVSQTLLVAATAMGLGAAFATAVCDEALERLVACDPVEEVVLGVAAIGHPARETGA